MPRLIGVQEYGFYPPDDPKGNVITDPNEIAKVVLIFKHYEAEAADPMTNPERVEQIRKILKRCGPTETRTLLCLVDVL